MTSVTPALTLHLGNFQKSAPPSWQPMFDKARDTIDKVFDSPTPPPAAETGTAPRASYDQSAVECNQEASRPYANVDFNFCMRTKGYELVTLPPGPSKERPPSSAATTCSCSRSAEWSTWIPIRSNFWCRVRSISKPAG